MKKAMKNLGLLLSAIVLLNVSCRQEESEFIEAPQEETLKANSAVASLLSRTASKDGSDDNIIDNASCLSIQLPVTVIANGIEIVVDSEDDFDIIEEIFDALEDDEDVLEILFPITIILSNFDEITINNLTELESYVAACPGENEYDDDIECADIKYPVTASVFNAQNEIIDTVTISDDETLFAFLEELDETDVVNINFPITVVLFDGTEVAASNLDDLEDILENAEDICDEDDDNDYNDDDCDNCTTEQLSQVLTGCSDWTVDKLERNDQNLEDQYIGYLFNFLNDGTLSATEGANVFSGTWSASGTANSISVQIDIPDLGDFNAVWNLHEIQTGGETDVDLRVGDDRLRFESSCSTGGGDGSTGSTLGAILIDGSWIVSSYVSDGIDETTSFSGYDFNFQAGGSVEASNGSTVTGNWSFLESSNKLILNFGTDITLEELNDDWDVVSVTDTQVNLTSVSGGDGSTDTLILTKQ
ncbi:hypothetical protein [Lentiprolixibacter aurantiacus]|uniref:Lipocalin-like domain-containing protein n=1 Tax=Lentiprolixibacter aurantiacus TaxID=2993939 RepID=A0AAE3MMU2_9FLAO|nr:hypothetical protein [Lentiprolixibacter aurantiacus]MCX2720334.1 hypothetical protein [Lentiprolixibacter aurantiacus]